MKKIKFEEFETLFKPIEVYTKERDDFISVELGGNLLDCYIDLLEKYLEIDDNWLAWWVFDTGMGKSEARVEDVKTSKVYDLKTLKDLYNFLTVLEN